MQQKCCTACGQTLPDPLPLDIALTGLKALLLKRVHKAGKHGIDGLTLFNHLYSGVGETPLVGLNVLPVMIGQLNRELVAHGKKIENIGKKGGPGNNARYCLVSL